MKYQHVVDVLVECYSGATYVIGTQGIKRHFIRPIFNTMSAKKLLSWKFSNLQILENRTLTVFKLQDWYWYQKKRNFVI